MGNNQSGEIKYMYTNIGGNSVSVPYIRLPNGQWVPLQQQNWYLQQWNAQRALLGASPYMNQNLPNPNLLNSQTMYPVTNQCDYYMPNNQAYYGGGAYYR